MFVDGDEDSDRESDGALPVHVHVLQTGQRRRLLRRRGRVRLRRSRRAEPLAALEPLNSDYFCKDDDFDVIYLISYCLNKMTLLHSFLLPEPI